MARPKGKPSAALVEQMLDEASWLLSHAQALDDYGRHEEAAAEQSRAASCEEQVACLLDADRQELEAAIHRVSAASCYEKLGQYVRAVTLLRAALAAPLRDDYRARVELLLAPCLAKVQKELSRAAKRGSGKPSSALP
jgi:tetratricopeptide (TPR) repeat protein